MTVNYLGVVHSVKAVLPSMLQNRSGHISFVSSSMGLIGAFLWAPAGDTLLFLQFHCGFLEQALLATQHMHQVNGLFEGWQTPCAMRCGAYAFLPTDAQAGLLLAHLQIDSTVWFSPTVPLSPRLIGFMKRHCLCQIL